MGIDHVPERPELSLKQDVAGVPVGDGGILWPVGDHALEVSETAECRANAVMRNGHDRDARLSFEPRQFRRKEAIGEGPDRLVVARVSKSRQKLRAKLVLVAAIEGREDPAWSGSSSHCGRRLRRSIVLASWVGRL